MMSNSVLVPLNDNDSKKTLNVLPIPYHSLKKEILSPEQLQKFDAEGYLVVPDVLSREQCEIVVKALIDGLNKSMLKDEDFKLDQGAYKTFDILTDNKKRKEVLKDPSVLYSKEKSSFRKILEIGHSGMTDFYFLPEGLLLKHNVNTYNVLRQLYEEERLHIAIERFGVKANRTNKIAIHMDVNLFQEDIEFKTRIQSLVTLEIDQNNEPKDSGTLAVIPGFHHYVPLARELFHPVRGFEPVKYSSIPKNHFFVMETPTDPLEKLRLPVLNEYIKIYHKLQINPKNEDLSSYLGDSRIFLENITYSEMWNHAMKTHERYPNLKLPANPLTLKLTTVPMEVGSMAVWSWFLPHRNERNWAPKNSGTIPKPRICGYLSYNPIHQEKGSRWESVQDRKHMFENFIGTVCKEKNPKGENFLEQKLAKDYYSKNQYSVLVTQDGNYGHVRTDNMYIKALLGFDPLTGEDYSWDDYISESNRLDPQQQESGQMDTNKRSIDVENSSEKKRPRVVSPKHKSEIVNKE